MPEIYAPMVARRVWYTLSTVRPSGDGPIPFRHAPLLATGNLGTIGVPLSSILCPPGLRQSMMIALGLPGQPLSAAVPEAERDGEFPELHRLRTDIGQFSELESGRQAELLACLNCLTEQDAAIRLARAVSTEHLHMTHGDRVLYEGARALIRRHPDNQASRGILRAISAHESTDPLFRFLAEVQLGAVAVRLDLDLAAAQAHVAAAERLRHQLCSGEFVDTVAHSRLSRLTALVAMRARDHVTQQKAMETANETARELMHLAADRPEYDKLVAMENLKMVGEAHLKVAAGTRNVADLERWAAELLALDPGDSSTWRDIAAAAIRCNLASEAAIALVGLVHVGGAGAVNSVAQIIRITEQRPRDFCTGLAEALGRAIDDFGATPSSSAEVPAGSHPVALAAAG